MKRGEDESTETKTKLKPSRVDKANYKSFTGLSYELQNLQYCRAIFRDPPLYLFFPKAFYILCLGRVIQHTCRKDLSCFVGRGVLHRKLSL